MRMAYSYTAALKKEWNSATKMHLAAK